MLASRSFLTRFQRTVRPAALVLVITVVPVGFGMTGAALAQPRPVDKPEQPQPADEDEKMADNYAEEGRVLALKGDYPSAYKSYIKAWKLRKSADIAGNLGATEYHLGKMRDAAEHLDYCLQLYRLSDASKIGTRERLKEALKEVSKKVGLAHIKVTRDDGGSAAGAEVFVDERQVGDVNTDGEAKKPLSNSNNVFVDPGSRKFKATYADCEDGEVTLAVKEGATVSVNIPLSCPTKLSVPIIVAGVGLTAVGAGLGIGTLVHSSARSEEGGALFSKLYAQSGQGACLISANKPDCDEIESAYDDTVTFRKIAIGSFVVGGAAAVATAIYLLATRAHSTPNAPKNAPVQAGFSVGPTGGSVAVWGAF